MSSSTSKPARLEPPFDERLTDGTGKISEAWQSWFTSISDAQFDTTEATTPVVTNGVIMQTGTSTSDPAGAISVALTTPYTTRTMEFQCDASPTEPHAFYNQGTVTTLPLDVITGTLSKDTGGGTIVAVPSVAFTWFAFGV